MMKRREFITLLGGATTWQLSVCAHQPARLARGDKTLTSRDDPTIAPAHD
jgi:hypothetical protein